MLTPRSSLILAGFAAFALSAGSSAQARNPMVGGAAMYPTRNIVENAVNSKDHTTLVAAVKASGLVDTLSSKGPFTVLHPPMQPLPNFPPARSTPW